MSCFKSFARAVRQTARTQTVFSFLAVVGLTNPGITAQEIETQREPMASNRSSNSGDPRDDAASGIAELPKEVIFELGNPLLHQRSYVLAVTFSPDGRWLASGPLNADSCIRVWDVSTGQLRQRLSPEDGKWEVASALAFTPDSKRLISGYRNGQLGVWELATGKRVLLTKRHEREIHTIAFSPDGKLLATGGEDGSIRISKLDALDQLLGMYESKERPSGGGQFGSVVGQNGVGSLSFTPDGRHLVAGLSTSNRILILQAADGTLERTLDLKLDTDRGVYPRGELQSLDLNQNGSQIIVGHYQRIPRKHLPGFGDYPVKNIQITEVGILDFETGEQVRELRNQQIDIGFGYSSLSPDGKSVALGLKNGVILVDSTTGETTHTLRVDGWLGDPVQFSPDGQLLAASVRNTIGLWEVKAGKRLFVEKPGHDSRVSTVDYSPDGKQIVTSGGDRIQVWDALTGEHLFTRTLGPHGLIRDVAFSIDSMLIAVTGNAEDHTGRHFGIAVVWSREGDRQRTLALPISGSDLMFSPDGKRLVVAYNNGRWGDTRLELWNLERPRGRLAEFPRDPLKGISRFVAMRFTPDGRYLLIAEQDGTVTKWDTSDEAADSSFVADWRPEDKRDSKVVEFRTPWLHHGDFTSDGKFLVTSTKDIYVWNVETGELVRTIEVPTANHGFRVKVAPDNYTIAASQVNYAGDPGEDTLLLFDMRLRSGRPILSLEPNDDRACSFAFSPDSTRLVTGLQRGTALVWDVSRGRLRNE